MEKIHIFVLLMTCGNSSRHCKNWFTWIDASEVMASEDIFFEEITEKGARNFQEAIL